MLLIRRLEEALARRYPEQEMRCPMHLCIGQEACAVGVCSALRPGDRVFGAHRAHGHYLALGGHPGRLVAELYGRASGCSGGRGGSMHLTDPAAGFVASTPIVGGTVPLAVGVALAESMRGGHGVAVCFFGDGCFEEGVVHESMNFAALRRLPVLFACENNGWAVNTPLRERQPERRLADVARAHGLAAREADGNDVFGVREAARELVDRARAGGGPAFLELRTTRLTEHCGPGSDEPLGLRPTSEFEAMRRNCPLARARAELLGRRAADPEFFEAVEEEVAAAVEEAFAFAEASPVPPPEPPGTGLRAA